MTDKARGILFLLVAVGCFGIVDGLSKVLVQWHSFGQIMLARYALALPALLAVTGPSGWAPLFRTGSASLQIVRGLTPLLVGAAMVVALMFLPLAEATVILFAGPFFVVALSGVLLGEKVGGSSWLGVCIGFVAVLIVARPGFGALSVYTIFPAIAAFFYALLQLLSRQLAMRGEPPITTLAWTLAVGLLISLPVAVADWRAPSLAGWLLFLALGIAFGASQYFLARSFALAPANVLTPFTYFQILAAVIFGFLAFGDVPDLWTVVGIVMILAAGAYVFGRNRAAQD